MVVKSFLSVLGVCAMAAYATVGFGQTVDSKMVEEDKALTQKLSLPCGHYAIGEILEMLSRQSSVALESGDPNDAGSGMEVTACLREVPLSNIMNALYALVSYKKHEWKWIRLGKAGSYVYKLYRPIEAQTLSADLKAWSQEGLEKQAKMLIDALQMSPEDLKKAAEKDSLLKILVDSPRLQDGIYEFSTLSPEMQMAVLRGSASPKLQVSQLDARGQEFVHEVWKQANSTSVRPDGSKSSTPEPTWIQFHVNSGGSPSPSMFIEIENLGGYGYFGGTPLEKDYRKYFNDLWMLPGDDAHVALEERILRFSPATAAKNKSLAMEECLGQLSEAVPLSFMARLPEQQTDAPRPSADLPLGKILGALQSYRYELPSKWRQGVLLLTDDCLYQNEPPQSSALGRSETLTEYARTFSGGVCLG